ncbi:uncharacterized protein O3C94_015658 [Discoglossus pictus]
MNKDKKIAGRILAHVLEILSLLTGEVSVLQHLTNSLTVLEINNDQKMTEKILNHTLKVIYLLTGEEYTIVKKNPPHSHLTGECDIQGYKDNMENHQTPRTLGIKTTRNSVDEDI